MSHSRGTWQDCSTTIELKIEGSRTEAFFRPHDEFHVFFAYFAATGLARSGSILPPQTRLSVTAWSGSRGGMG